MGYPGTTIRTCSGCRHRQISPQGDQTYGKEESCKTLDHQTLLESRQLQPSYAHKVQCGRCIEQSCCEQRGVERRKQTSQSTNRNQTKTRRALQHRKKQVVLPETPLLDIYQF